MAESIKELRKICQGPVKVNVFYERLFARRVSIYFTKLFLYTNLSANSVSVLMLIIGIIASIFFGIQGYIYPIIAGLLLQLWYILDHVDGEVARYRKQTSAKGLFIDLINHHIVHPLIFFFISLGLYNKFNDFRILLIGTFIMFSLLLQDLINLDKKEAKEVIEGNKTNLINKQNLSLKGRLFKKITQIFYKFPGIMNILFITAILDQLLLIFLFYGFSFPIMIFLKILHNLRTPKHKF